jgi:hypothetical protein
MKSQNFEQAGTRQIPLPVSGIPFFSQLRCQHDSSVLCIFWRPWTWISEDHLDFLQKKPLYTPVPKP